MALEITTDNKFKDFKYRYEVPPTVLESQFDWTNKDYEDNGDYSDGFFCYRGCWYHLEDFMVTIPPDLNGNWHGFHSDSFFSGVAIELSRDCEQYKVATVIARV